MSVRIGVETIAAWAKNDVDLIVCGKGPLGVSRRFEPTHYFLSLPSRSVRSFCPIVQSFVGSVISLWCLCSDRFDVTAQLISNDNARITIAGEQALEKAHRCLCVTSLLHKNIKCVASPLASTARHSQKVSPTIWTTTSSRCHLSAGRGRSRLMQAAKKRPKRVTQLRTVSRLTITPRSANKSSTSAQLSAKR